VTASRPFLTIAGATADLAIDARCVLDVRPRTAAGSTGLIDPERFGWRAARAEGVPERVLMLRALHQLTPLLAVGPVKLREVSPEALLALPLEALGGFGRALTDVVLTEGGRPLLVLEPELLLRFLTT
jgi:hypothetical protein